MDRPDSRVQPKSASANGLGGMIPLLSPTTGGVEAERDPESDGRGNSRTQLFSLLIMNEDGDEWLVPYSAIHAANGGKRKSGTFCFRFRDSNDDMQEVRLKAVAGKLDEFRGVIDRLAAGKREYLRAGEILESVKVELAT